MGFSFPHPVTQQARPGGTCPLLPSRLGEDNNGPAAALEGRFHSANCSGLGGVAVEGGQTTQFLKQLPVKDGGFGLPGNLQEQHAFGDSTHGRRSGTGQGEVLQHRVPHLHCQPVALALTSELRLSSLQQHVPAEEPLDSQGSFFQWWHLALSSPHSGDTHANCQALSLCSCLLGSLPGTGSAHMAAVTQGWHGQ